MRMLSSKVALVTSSAALLSILIGCGRDEANLTYAEMSPEDIIVQVNSNILRKSEMQRFYRMNMAYVNTLKGGNAIQEAQRRIKDDMLAYAPQFVEQMLLVDDAKRNKVLTPEEVAKRVEEKIEEGAKAKKMTKEAFLNQFEDAAWFARKTAETRIWINAHVATNIPPKYELTRSMVSNYVNFINAETAAVTATNAWKKAKLAEIRKGVIAGRMSFTNEAARLSAEDWNLGDLERTEIDFGAELRNQIFSVPGGIVLEPIEDDEGYRLIQVAKVIPGTKDAKGRLVDREKRRIYQIYLEKEDYPLQMSEHEATLELHHQFLTKAIAERVEWLKTNGENTVVWPHGQNLWKKEK